MSTPVFHHHWDIADLSRALDAPPDEVKAFFIDGRRGGFLLEGVVARKIGGAPAPAQGSPYDVKDAQGRLWEVRALTPRGIRFNPASQQGAGRAYEEGGFLAKVSGVAGYYIADLARFPDVPFYQVPSSTVVGWHRSGQMKGAHLSYAQAKALFAG